MPGEESERGTAAPRPEGPAGRYGRARKGASRRAWIPLAAVLAAAGVAGAAYATWASDQHPKATVVTFRASDGGVQVTANVRRDPDRTTECTLRARNHDGAEVGRRLLVIPPGEGRKVTVSEFLETSERPVTGELRDCRSVR